MCLWRERERERERDVARVTNSGQILAAQSNRLFNKYQREASMETA